MGMQGYFIVPARNLGLLNGYVKKNGVVLVRADNRVLRDAICGSDIVHVMVSLSLGRRTAVLAHRAGVPVSGGFHAMAENFTVHLFMKDTGPANRLTYRYYSDLYRNCDAIHYYPTQFFRDLCEGMSAATIWSMRRSSSIRNAVWIKWNRC